MAMHFYYEKHGRLPPAVVYGEDGMPLLSWRVLILPDMGREELYRQFKLDEPWDGPHNVTLLERMPAEYAPPRGKAHKVPEHHTVCQVFVGPGAAFEGRVGLDLRKDFPDGIGNTFLIVEGGPAVPWTKPVDVAFGADTSLPELSTLFHNGFRVSYADGVTRFIKKDTDEARLRATITRNGGDMPLPAD
jgi:hypothetical protein